MRKLFVIPIMLFCTGHACAEDEWGLWTTIEADRKISKQWSVEGTVEYRLGNDMSRTERWSLGLGTSYRFAKWLKADAGYDYIANLNAVDARVKNGYEIPDYTYWQPRHRFHVSFIGSQKLGRWRISLRERWQYTYHTAQDIYGSCAETGYREPIKHVKGKAEHILRSRLLVDYNFKKLHLTPYVSCEVHSNDRIEKTRYCVGTEYDFSKHHSLSLSYIFQDKADSDEPDGHIINISYGFKF